MAEVGTQREDMASDLLVAEGATLEGADGEGVTKIMNAGAQAGAISLQCCASCHFGLYRAWTKSPLYFPIRSRKGCTVSRSIDTRGRASIYKVTTSTALWGNRSDLGRFQGPPASDPITILSRCTRESDCAQSCPVRAGRWLEQSGWEARLAGGQAPGSQSFGDV